ncbi:hypothetical protein F3Y22_tig00112738pilonHSYRG00633 [Hibiscus syriacus]|uniref:RING-type domain-containing protein n=1 Tax=Hibiscus syriacus TaxID=106335 RepID=A0A6A2WUV8_HIBSY|nr:hypothetical protein F3Y22_tig00112738pilonHSYRG00633 [Hibiscus syriacus]
MPVNFPVKHTSAVDNSLAGLTLDDVLGKAKQATPPPAQNNAKQSAPLSEKQKGKQSATPPEKKKDKQSATSPAQNKAKQSEPLPAQNRTLPDAVPDDTSTKDKVGWKLFREKFLHKKAAGRAWTSSIRIPASDVNVQGNRSQRRGISFTDANHTDDGGERARAGKPRPQLARRTSVRFDNHDPPDATIKPQNVHHDDDNDNDEDDFLSEGSLTRKERSLSAREAVASQEAAEAAAAVAKQEEAEKNGSPESEEPVKMSLMDLLGDEYEEDDEEEEEEEEQEDEEEIVQSKGIEFTCSICNVNISSSAYMPCAHTFCRLCSKELSVQRGSCPLCTAYVSEILHIF